MYDLICSKSWSFSNHIKHVLRKKPRFKFDYITFLHKHTKYLWVHHVFSCFPITKRTPLSRFFHLLYKIFSKSITGKHLQYPHMEEYIISCLILRACKKCKHTINFIMKKIINTLHYHNQQKIAFCSLS